MTQDTHPFTVHTQLLWHVIRRQSGSLARAVVEGIVNAVDAGASAVTVTATRTTLTITDNGRGFGDRAEVARCFATFGTPPERGERKRFGAFRVGRGQLFAFGRNVWRSGRWRMEVDLDAQARASADPSFRLREHRAQVRGCRIRIALYDPLTSDAVPQLVRDIREAVRYLDVPVTVNGDRVSSDPAEESWDRVTPEGYFRVRDSGRLAVYNLGVHVTDLLDSRFGAGGVVVSRQPLRLNVTRTHIMAGCPVWGRIAHQIARGAKRRIRRAPDAPFSESERRHIAQQIAAGTYPDADVTRLRILTDVRGDVWSIDGISQYLRRRDIHTVTVAPRWAWQGDRLMQFDRAFVFAQDTLDMFGVDSVEGLFQLVRPYSGGQALVTRRVLSVEDAATFVSVTWRKVPTSAWSAEDRRMVAFLDEEMRVLIPEEIEVRLPGRTRPSRHLMLGHSSQADACTDGRTYIMLAARLIRDVSTISRWHTLWSTMLHEWCHDEPTTAAHYHTREFHERFHRLERRVGLVVERSVERFPQFTIPMTSPYAVEALADSA